MKRKTSERVPALDLIEEAVYVLRAIPASILFSYHVGTLPFAMAFLYFIADMSRSASAADSLLAASFAMALIYVWMKYWQTVFAVKLLSWLSEDTSSVERLFSPRRIIRILKTQLVVQPHEIYLLPLSLLAVFPFAWVYAFFHNVTVTGDGSTDIQQSIRRSWRLALLWPFQNHKTILILGIFSVVVMANVAVLIVFLPSLIQWLSGIETVFTLSNVYLLLNTTYLSIVLAVTWLCMSPLAKVVYVLRCFYGQSRKTGADLMADFRRVVSGEQLQERGADL